MEASAIGLWVTIEMADNEGERAGSRRGSKRVWVSRWCEFRPGSGQVCDGRGSRAEIPGSLRAL